MIRGCDISVYQGTVDFAKMKAAGVNFVILKATQGNYWDSKFKANWQASQGILPRAAYHFYDWNYTLQANIDALCNAYTLYPCEFNPVLDFESTVNAPGQTTAASYCLRFLQEVESRIGKTPLLYTSPGYWASHGSSSAEFSKYPLWIAHYGVSIPTVPKPWSKWHFWQYTSKGDGKAYGVASMSIDLDYWNGTLEEFKAWAGLLPPPAPEPTLEQRLAACEAKLADHEARIQALEAINHIYLPIVQK